MTGLGLFGRGLGVRLGGLMVIALGVVGCALACSVLALAWLVSPRRVLRALCDAVDGEDDGDHGGYDHGLSVTKGLPYDYPLPNERPCRRDWEERA